MASDENVGPGSVVGGKYRIQRLVGRGGMGQVFEAWHSGLERSVAIKLLKEKAFADAVATERFLREARISARLQNDHAVRVFDVDRLPSGRPYIVMELLDGADLAQVSRKRTIGVVEAVDYALQATEALAEAHALGLIHRDLKPHNLFLAQDAKGQPRIKVVDFGLAKQVVNPEADDAVTRVGSIVGTPNFMSPEQIRAPEKVDHRADIWALGATLFAMLAGHPPFVSDELDDLIHRILQDPAPRISAIRPDVPKEIDDVVARCLEKNPEDRHADIHAVAAALRDAIGALGAQTTVQDPAPQHTLRMDGLRSTPPEHPSLLPSSGASGKDDSSHVIAGRFRVLGRLGSGGMGDVYRAHDTLLDRSVALKVLKSSGEEAARDRHRVVREARAAASLSHPNAVTIFDVGEDGEQVFIAMELVLGESLHAIIRRGNATAAARLRWLREVAKALLAAHERGLVHRDVKPENMLVCSDGSLKLLDFGIAKRSQQEPEVEAEGAPSLGPSSVATGAGRRVGTPRYMAPEQREGLPTDARTDQYSWGVVALELFGTKIDSGLFVPGVTKEDAQKLTKQLVAEAKKRDPALTDGLGDAIERTLRRTKEERFPTFEPIIRALESAERAHRSAASDRKWVLAAIGAVAIVFAVFAFRSWRSAQLKIPPPVPMFVCTPGPTKMLVVDPNTRVGLDLDGRIMRVSEIKTTPHVERLFDDAWVSATTSKAVTMGFQPDRGYDDAFVAGMLYRGRPGYAVGFTDKQARLLHIFSGSDFASFGRYAGSITGFTVVDLSGTPLTITTTDKVSDGNDPRPTTKGTVMTATFTGEFGIIDPRPGRLPSAATAGETIAFAWGDPDGFEFAFFDSFFRIVRDATTLAPTASASAVAFDGKWATVFWVGPKDGKPRLWSARIPLDGSEKPVPARLASTDDIGPESPLVVELANHRSGLAWTTAGTKPLLRFAAIDDNTGELITPTDIADASGLGRLQASRGRTDTPSLLWSAGGGSVRYTKLACAAKLPSR